MSIASRIESMTEHLTNDWNIVDSLGLYTKKLPKEYTQVDYIQSSGSQYINTGINADKKLRVELEMAFVNPTASNQTIGTIKLGSPNVRYHVLCGASTIAVWLNDAIYSQITGDNNKHYYDINPLESYIKCDNNITTIPSDIGDTERNFWLFGRNSTGSIYMAGMKIWSCKMYYNNELVRDFIPCYRNSDNVVGLYDLVNGIFYENNSSSTIQFIYGEIQEAHIDRNLENLNLPLKDLYNDVSDKTDISENGVVGRTSQESTTGKNLLYIASQYDYGQNGVNGSYNENDGSFTITGTATTSGNSQVTRTIPLVLEAGTYTFSLDHTISKQIYLHFTFAGGATQNILIPAGQTEATGTLTADTTGYNIRFAVIDGNTYNEKVHMQLESGSTATNWEEYTGGQPSPNPSYSQPINNLSGDVAYKITTQNGEQTFTIPLGDIELCKIDTYEDKIYSSNGRFYLYKNIIKKTIDGNSTPYGTSSDATPTPRTVCRVDLSNIFINTMYYSNRFIPNSQTANRYVPVINNQSPYMSLDNTITGINVSDTDEQKIAKLKEYFSSNNIIVYYPTTPTTTEITQENYPSLYNALKQIQDYLTAYKINKEFILGYSSPEIEY